MPPRRFCDDVGLDVISAGGTITWAMECGEKGLLEGVGERVVLLNRLFNEREGWAGPPEVRWTAR